MRRCNNPCSWWRGGHAWLTNGLVAPLSMQETCARCGLVRIFNGALDETTYYRPKEAQR